MQALSMWAIKLALDRIMLTTIVDYLYNQHRITGMPQIKTCSRRTLSASGQAASGLARDRG